ncbi:MAG: hypothetical protein P1V35_08530 [Planctomycetota bacterium]|nr:hypothetical protein [Planctomycetota bacterium]
MKRNNAITKALLGTLILGLTSCGLTGDQWAGARKKGLAELNAPGFLDVGLGVGFLSDDVFDSSDGTGTVLALRAYPAGRWYSTLKEKEEKLRKDFSEAVAKAIANGEVLTEEQLASSDAAKYYSRVLQVKKATVDLKIAESRLAGDPGFKGMGHLDSDVASALHATDKDDFQVFLVAIQAELPKASNTTVDTDTLASENGRKAIRAFRTKIEAGASSPSLTPEQLAQAFAAVDAGLESQAYPEFYIVEDRANWFHRLSVFYGRSTGDFGGSIDGAADLVGIGYDVAPQFSLLAGWAFVDRDDDSDSSMFFGTSINLNAFKGSFGSLFGN